MPLVKHNLPYFHDSALLFERIKHMQWPMFLDLLNTILAPYLDQVAHSDLPFTGGALGYFSYDLGRHLEQLPAIASDDIQTPEMMVGIYDWVIIVDHRQEEACLVSNRLFTSDAQWLALCEYLDGAPTIAESSFSVTSSIESNFDEAAYAKAFNQIQDYIAAGDCYQVNLAQRFTAEVSGDAWGFYEQFRQNSPAPFMAYMHFDEVDGESFDILSVSPERFLHVIGAEVETRPIKGTRPRYDHPDKDLNSAIELVTSFKDRAENVMIVDLLRNDIGKVCEVGSVKADKLFNLESFANVHHLVSYITGKLLPDQSAVDLLKHCFPGGSITGAPKLRAMEIIEALEPHRRGVYCGAIGYIGFNGDMDTSITIRTAVIKENRIYFHAGGGIVADSIVDKEYEETLDKASNFLTTVKYFMRN